MTGHIHPADKADAIEWLIKQVKTYSPEYAKDQVNRNRMHLAEQMRDAEQREARK